MVLEVLSTVLTGVGEIANSPFIVPVAGCFMIAVIVIASTAAASRKREIESQERLAAIAKGLVPPPTQEELAMTRQPPATSAYRRYSNIRLTGIILLGGALGVILFFCVLSWIIGDRHILAGAAAGLVPLGLGIGFLADANLQKRELESSELR